jgi:hypothetical protein
MSKTKKTLATALVALAAAAPVASFALAGGSNGVHLACQGGSTGCFD